jgi:aldehyde dehydrogenase (NAD+)
MTEEMGAPEWTSYAQVASTKIHMDIAIENLKKYEFEEARGNSLISKEPIGVCGLITPWNLPVSVIMTKLLPALAVGCTTILKPSEYSSLSAQILAEVLQESGVPAGVFNLVYGDGPTVGSAISRHPDVDLVSITGSTRAGIEVARNAADTVKRVHQELGGKSPNVLLPSAEFAKAVPAGVKGLMFNAGQNCSAPSRMLVPNSRMDEVKALAVKAIADVTVGPPSSYSFIGPVVNKIQYQRIQSFIEKGIAEGATVLVGGLGKPEGLETGFYVKPTIFADTTPEMTIVREEIFGPVLVIQGYDDIEDAIVKANDTVYGLAAYFQGSDINELREIASRIAAGQVYLNGSGIDLVDFGVPFGGFKRSGNGREWGDYAFGEFIELKSYIGYMPTPAAE